MKKQKKWLIYLLVLLVVFIWGVILQRILAQADALEEPLSLVNTGSSKTEKLPQMLPDTFSLMLNYRDPFATSEQLPGQMGSTLVGEKVPLDQKALNTIRMLPVLNTLNVAPLQLSYLGFVQNQVLKKRVAIINFNGKELMLSEGESAGELQLLRIAPTEVIVKIKNQLKHIKQTL